MQGDETQKEVHFLLNKKCRKRNGVAPWTPAVLKAKGTSIYIKTMTSADQSSAINCNVPLLFFRLIEKVKLESAACIVLIIVLFSVTACKTSLVSLGHLELISRATQRAFPWYLGPWRPLSQKPSGGCAVHICL